MSQAKKIRKFLEWLDNCPFKHRISSMQGDTVCFVRFWLEETPDEEEQKLNNLLATMRKKEIAK